MSTVKLQAGACRGFGAHPRIFRLFMKGKFDPYVHTYCDLWPKTSKIKYVVDWSTAYNFMVYYILDILCCQPIKLFQVVSILQNFMNINGTTFIFIFFVPSGFCRASEASNSDCFKIKVWKFQTKIWFPNFKIIGIYVP